MELTVSSPSMISLKVKLYFVNSVLQGNTFMRIPVNIYIYTYILNVCPVCRRVQLFCILGMQKSPTLLHASSYLLSKLPPFDYDYSILPAQLHQTMFHFEAFGPLANHDMPVFCVFIIQAMKYYLVKF